MTFALARAGGRRAWRDEARATLALAWPIILTNLLQIGADHDRRRDDGPARAGRARRGRARRQPLLRLSCIAGIGLRHRGLADDRARARRAAATRCATCGAPSGRACGAAIAISIPVWAILWFAEPILLALGQEPDWRCGAGRYMLDAAVGLPAVPRLHRAAQLHRRRGAAALGALGRRHRLRRQRARRLVPDLRQARIPAPRAGRRRHRDDVLVHRDVRRAGRSWSYVDRKFRRYHLFGRFWRADWARFRQLWALGLPIAATLVFEVSIFNAAVFLMGLIGTDRARRPFDRDPDRLASPSWCRSASARR